MVVTNIQRDVLTGLYNRHYLNSALDREFQRAKKLGWPLSVAFIDLDNFKQINDTYGPQSGDKVLQKAAKTFQANIRDTDIVAHYGGQKFVVILVGTGAEGARITCERVVTVFRNTYHYISPGEQLVVTISIGLATEGQAVKFETPLALLKASEFSAYSAKAMGHNRFVEYNAVHQENFDLIYPEYRIGGASFSNQ